MTIKKRTETQVEVIPPLSILRVRVSNILEENGKELTRTFHRHVVAPGDDVSNESIEVQTAAKAFWTPEKIAAYKARAGEPS